VTTFHPLACLYVRYDCYWPQTDDDGFAEDPRPILISVDLLFTGGYTSGMKVDSDANLTIVFIDEYGQAFECKCASHRPWRVVSFLRNGLVRLRLFSSNFYWTRFESEPLRHEDYGHVAIAVTDSDGERHHFIFPAEPAIRDLFPVPFMEGV
jgi:hypothetical protein